MKIKLKSVLKEYKIPIVFILCVLLVGIFITMAIVHNSIPSRASNDGWLAFIGGILGSIISFVAAMSILTISQQKETERNEDNQRISLLPLLRIRDIKKCNPSDNNKYYLISDTENPIDHIFIKIDIENLGIGPCINLHISNAFEILENNKKEKLNISETLTMKISNNNIKLKSDIPLYIIIGVKEYNIIMTERTFEMTLSFSDLLGNKYEHFFQLGWWEQSRGIFRFKSELSDFPIYKKNLTANKNKQ